MDFDQWVSNAELAGLFTAEEYPGDKFGNYGGMPPNHLFYYATSGMINGLVNYVNISRGFLTNRNGQHLKEDLEDQFEDGGHCLESLSAEDRYQRFLNILESRHNFDPNIFDDVILFGETDFDLWMLEYAQSGRSRIMRVAKKTFPDMSLSELIAMVEQRHSKCWQREDNDPHGFGNGDAPMFLEIRRQQWGWISE
jgi:hypothetical protein